MPTVSTQNLSPHGPTFPSDLGGVLQLQKSILAIVSVNVPALLDTTCTKSRQSIFGGISLLTSFFALHRQPRLQAGSRGSGAALAANIAGSEFSTPYLVLSWGQLIFFYHQHFEM